MKPLDQELFDTVCGKARMTERIARVRDLLGRGANAKVKGDYGLTPLHYAVWNHEPGSAPLAKLLLDAGADPNAVGSARVPPLISAVETNDDVAPARIDASLELIALLLEHGAKVPPKLPLADFSCASVKIFNRMWKLGASPELPNENGQSAIHATVATQRPALVKALLDAGVALDRPDKLGHTPLASALAMKAHTPKQARVRQEIIDMLAAKGAPETSGKASKFPLAELRAAVTKAKLASSVKGVFAANVASGEDLIARLKGQSAEDLTGLMAVVASVLGKPTRVAKGKLTIKTPFFHHGDLVVKGHLQVQAPFAVTGNVVVDGVMEDCGPDSFVLVGGNLTVHSLHTDGELGVDGMLVARDIVYGYYNDNTLRADSIRARLVVADEHDIAASVRAALYLDSDKYRQGRDAGVNARLAELLVPDVFDDDGALDRDELFAWLRRGKPVWAKSKQNKPRPKKSRSTGTSSRR